MPYTDDDLKAILRGDPIPADQAGHYNAIAEQQRQQTLRLHKAIMLTHTIDDCVDLLNGKDVPAHRYRPEWAAKYGLAA